MFPRILISGESLQELPATLIGRGYLPVAAIGDADVVLITAGTGPDDLAVAVQDRGVGVVALGAAAPDLVAAAGIHPAPAPTGRVVAADEKMATNLDLLARVSLESAVPATGFRLQDGASPLLLTSGGDVIAAIGALGDGRVVALGLEPSGELLHNALSYAALSSAAARPAAEAPAGDLPATAHLLARRAVADHPAWLALKTAAIALQAHQAADGSVADPAPARPLVATIVDSIADLAPEFPHDADYLAALVKDFTRWADAGLGVPDFLDSLMAFHPERDRVDGRQHLVVFPMYTQNGSTNRFVEAVLLQVIWPEFIGDLEDGAYSNKLFVPIRFIDFTPGYDTNCAVLFPETVAMREVPKFTWGAIFADREAARFRTVVGEAAALTGLSLPPDAARLLEDQQLAEQTFVMWDLIHDRTHMHGDLPFDPFMIKQRMPYFLYSLEELRCDLTAFRESVALEAQGVPHARLVQYAILFDRIFRFAITGPRVRNYDGLGGQLLFAWLHQHRVLHWTDNRLSIEWDAVTAPILELGRQIDELYWRAIDRPKISHWLAAYQLVSSTVEPHPASVWAKGAAALPLDGPPKGLTDAMLPDEFPLSMFYEALNRKLGPVVAATAGITG